MRETEKERIVLFFKSLSKGELKDFLLTSEDIIKTSKFVVYKQINGTLVGIGGLREGHSIFVLLKREFSGRGIGQEILREVINRAKELKIKNIHLSVFKTNGIGIHIYEKLGFKKRYIYKQGKKDAWYMGMDLK